MSLSAAHRDTREFEQYEGGPAKVFDEPLGFHHSPACAILTNQLGHGSI